MSTTGPETPEAAGATLARRLGLRSATALVVGEVIGVGIFLTPAGMARSLGSPAWLLLAWVAMGASALAGALCLGALAARDPEVGGNYAFLRRAYGPRIGFLYGWLSLLVTDPGLTAALAAGLATYAGSIVHLSALGQKAVAVGAIAAAAAANVAGVGLGAGMLRTFSLLKLGLLAAIAFWGFGLGLGDWSNLLPLLGRRPGSDPLPMALAGGLVAAFFSFGGWWDLGKLAGEVRDPGRNLPRALVLGIAAVTAAYVLISAVFLYLVPLSRVATDEGFAAQVGEALFGRAGAGSSRRRSSRRSSAAWPRSSWRRRGSTMRWPATACSRNPWPRCIPGSAPRSGPRRCRRPWPRPWWPPGASSRSSRTSSSPPSPSWC